MKKNKNDKVVIKGDQILSQHTQQILEYLFEKCGMIGKKK